MSDFSIAIAEVLKHEGGLADNPADPGGATNFGVSLRYLLARGDLDHDGLPDGDLDHDGDVDADDIRRMSEVDATRIYRSGWWDKYAYGSIRDQAVATKVLDMAVNMGARQAHKLLQRACNDCGVKPALADDGVIGPRTIQNVNSVYAAPLLKHLRARCLTFYSEIITRNPELAVFRAGWEKRALS